MKATRFLLLAVLLLAFVAVLASCDMITGLLGGDDTTEATTTAPTTTATVTTTSSVSTNPIASATRLDDGRLRIKYTDGKNHILGVPGTNPNGNNAVLADYALGADGVLTLTFRDSASYNTANVLLEKTFYSVTLRIREANGNLEWAREGSDSFTVLCPAKQNTNAADPLNQLIAAADLFGNDDFLGKGMIFTVSGNKLRFRATEWKDGLDFCNDADYSRSGGNRYFNLTSMKVVSDSLAHTDATSGTTWKGTGDDCTPLHFNGTYIGANHGYNIIAKIPNADKTNKDIGSVWKDEKGQKFCIVRITNGDLWMCPFDDDSMADGNFAEYCATVIIKAGTTLTHVSGATNKADISVATDNDPKDMQFFVSANHIERRAFLNGVKEVDPKADGVYEAEFIDFYESYDIMYLPAVLKYLQKNVGRNDDDSHHVDEIEGAYVNVKNTYRFHKNGSIVVYSDYVFEKDIPKLGMISGVQSGALTSTNQYIYLPGTTTYAVPRIQNATASTYVKKSELVNPNVPVSSYFQMTDALGTKAMNLGYCTTYGYGIPEARLPYLKGSMGFYYTSLKMYPHLFTDGSLKAGDRINFISYRIPSEATDSDFTAINWYWVDDDIYLSLHTTKEVAERKVDLPDYMDGMTITSVEGSASFTVSSTTVAADGITVSSTGAGYTIVKLSPAN